MKKYFLLIFTLVLTLGLFSCESDGKKFAKESMECFENAIDNSSSIEEAQSAIADCQSELRAKYQERAMNDPKFQKDAEDASKDFEKVMESKLLKKFGSIE